VRIDRLTRRMAAAPRWVVLGLIALSALISPGFVRVRDSAHGLAGAWRWSPFVRETAVSSSRAPTVSTARAAHAWSRS
jgi:hypothetical protein